MFLAGFSRRASATPVGIRAVFVRDITMPPKRRQPNRIPVEEAVERDRTTQLEQHVAQLAEQMARVIANLETLNLPTRNPRLSGDEEESTEDSEHEEEIPQPEIPQRRRPVRDHREEEIPPPRRPVREVEENRRWETGMRTEVPEFQGNLTPEEFLEWLGIVEEILEFKNVPDNTKVALVATRLRGRAAAWWQQLKLTRNRAGKNKISDWEKMKRKMRAEFLPHNFQRLLYQKLQNLRQGLRSVDDYTTEFYQLLVRNDIQETPDQLVSRYCGGLRPQILDVVNLFDPITVSEAHQRALQIEKNLVRRTGGGPITGNNTGSIGRTGASSSNPGWQQRTAASSSSGSGPRPLTNQTQQPNTNQVQQPRTVTGGVRCFSCGEVGHRQSECRKLGKRSALFNETDDSGEGDAEVGEEAEFDDEVVEEDHVDGDSGPLLVVRRAFLTPRAEESDWLRNNVFQSTCTILGKVCRYVIDGGSCENIIAVEAVRKLGMKTEKHPRPYKLVWLQKGGEIMVSQRVLVPFSMGTNYKDQVWCDVVHMDACHLLLGRPWQYDRKVKHDGYRNTYTLRFNNTDIVLLPGKNSEKPKSPDSTNLLSFARFESEMEEAETIFVLLNKEKTAKVELPQDAVPLLTEFPEVFPEELPEGLPPLRDIQHQIDLEPGAVLPNRPHYRMSPVEHEELRRQVEDLLAKGHIRESLSPCAVPALLIPKKDGSWRMCVDSRAINKITVRYRFPIPRLDDLLDQISGATVFTKLDLKSGYHQIQI